MEPMDPFWFVTLVTLLAGAGGTGIGGAVGALVRSDSNKAVSLLLAFAGGVMTAIVCLDLLVEAAEASGEAVGGVWLAVLSVAVGVAVVYGLNYVIDKRTASEVPHTAEAGHPKTHDDIDELVHADHLAQHRRNNDSRASLVVAGIVMACAIALHNIPEGMAVSVPLISGGMGRVRAVLLTAACGAPTVLGAWLGIWLGEVGPLGLTLSLGFASGAMLYVVYGEIIPESILIYRSKAPAFAVIAGILLGLVMMTLPSAV